jgi:CRISPR-associated protein Csx3
MTVNFSISGIELKSQSDSKEYSAILLSFEIEGGIISPEELPSVVDSIDSLRVIPQMGIVLSGRGPIWLYAAMIHRLHVTRWVAVHDPRLGAVVASAHHPGAPSVGTILEFSAQTN